MKRKTKRDARSSARPSPIRLLIFLCIGLALAAAAGALVAAAAPDAGASSARDKALRNPFKVRLKPVKLVARSRTGPTPPANVKFKDAPGDLEVSVRGASVAGAPGEVVIVGVPAYKWRDGCGPTAAAMVVGYWDGHGYDDLVPGSAEWQTAEVDQMISTHGAAESPGHYEDYALPGETGATVLPDKSELPLGDEHASNSVADFAHTSWSVDGSFYGSTWSSLLGPGFTGFVKLKYPDNTPTSRTFAGTNLTWTMVKNEIDAGRPMVFLVDSSGDARTDHFVPVIGYRETNGIPEYACWDTWSTTTVRWQQFRSMSTSYAWGVWGSIMLDPGSAVTPTPDPTPIPTPTPTPPPTPATDTVAPVTAAVGADDAWHNTSVTIGLAATDVGSGVAYTEYSLDGLAWARGTSLTLTLGKNGVNSGVHAVAYRAADKAGNVEIERYAYVRLDGVKPATSKSTSSTTLAGSTMLTLKPTDAHSGVGSTRYSVDGGAFVTGTSVLVTGRGTHVVKYYSVDVAGNVEGTRSTKVLVK